MIYGLLFAMVVGGFIGWITNWLAVKAIFRPREPKKILFIEYQGLMPKRHAELADNVGRLVDDELINAKMLVNQIKPEDLEPFVKSIASKARKDVEERLKASLSEFTKKIPFMHNFTADSFIGSMMDKAENEIFNIVQKQLPEVIETAGKHVCEKFSVQKIVTEKIAEMDICKIEELFDRIANKEMKAIVHLGGILGAIVGAIQFLIQFYVLNNVSL